MRPRCTSRSLAVQIESASARHWEHHRPAASLDLANRTWLASVTVTQRKHCIGKPNVETFPLARSTRDLACFLSLRSPPAKRARNFISHRPYSYPIHRSVGPLRVVAVSLTAMTVILTARFRVMWRLQRQRNRHRRRMTHSSRSSRRSGC